MSKNSLVLLVISALAEVAEAQSIPEMSNPRSYREPVEIQGSDGREYESILEVDGAMSMPPIQEVINPKPFPRPGEQKPLRQRSRHEIYSTFTYTIFSAGVKAEKRSNDGIESISYDTATTGLGYSYGLNESTVVGINYGKTRSKLTETYRVPSRGGSKSSGSYYNEENTSTPRGSQIVLNARRIVGEFLSLQLAYHKVSDSLDGQKFDLSFFDLALGFEFNGGPLSFGWDIISYGKLIDIKLGDQDVKENLKIKDSPMLLLSGFRIGYVF